MNDFLLRCLKGFGYGLLIGPIAVAVFSYVQSTRHNLALNDLREARATIRNAQIITPKGASAAEAEAQAEYTLDLQWRDEQGRERRADNVAIQSRLARRLIDGQDLVQDSVRIRYKATSPDRVLMIEPQLSDITRRDALYDAFTASGHSWPLAMIGGLMFYFALKRESRRRPDGMPDRETHARETNAHEARASDTRWGAR